MTTTKTTTTKTTTVSISTQFYSLCLDLPFQINVLPNYDTIIQRDGYMVGFCPGHAAHRFYFAAKSNLHPILTVGGSSHPHAHAEELTTCY